MTELEFLYRVFAATAFDHCDSLFWRTDSNYAPLTLFVNCNDVFAWACADCERVTPENIQVLEQAIKDCAALNDRVWGPVLFVARVRQERPQGAMLKDIDPPVRALFDACGEKRAVDFSNPYEHPDDGGKYAYSEPTCGVPHAEAAVDPHAGSTGKPVTRD